jgi:hypothetical protein
MELSMLTGVAIPSAIRFMRSVCKLCNQAISLKTPAAGILSAIAMFRQPCRSGSILAYYYVRNRLFHQIAKVCS